MLGWREIESFLQEFPADLIDRLLRQNGHPL
jgi:hypothetical protein